MYHTHTNGFGIEDLFVTTYAQHIIEINAHLKDNFENVYLGWK